MRYYPAFLDLSGKHCLVCGVGTVGLRKLRTLLDCGPESVLALDVHPASAEVRELSQAHSQLRYEVRPFVQDDLSGTFLVIASTADAGLNARIAEACAEHSILCNVVDDPEAGNFIVPAHMSDQGLTVCVSTHGASPALSRRIRRDLQTHFGSRYTGLIEFMRRVRPLVLELGHPSDQNATLFRSLVDSQLADVLRIGDAQAAQDMLRELLPPDLHPRIGELLDGIY